MASPQGRKVQGGEERHQPTSSLVLPGSDVGDPGQEFAGLLRAVMPQEARLGPGNAALEIGSGGFHADLTQELVSPGGRIVSVGIDPFVTERAIRFLTGSGYGHMTVLLGHSARRSRAPPHRQLGRDHRHRRGARHPPAWIDQLAESGRLVAPLRIHSCTWAVAFEKRNGLLESRPFTVCGFVPLPVKSMCSDLQPRGPGRNRRKKNEYQC
jgi:protein-L-isoaspartate O-methyltransferase